MKKLILAIALAASFSVQADQCEDVLKQLDTDHAANVNIISTQAINTTVITVLGGAGVYVATVSATVPPILPVVAAGMITLGIFGLMHQTNMAIVNNMAINQNISYIQNNDLSDEQCERVIAIY